MGLHVLALFPMHAPHDPCGYEDIGCGTDDAGGHGTDEAGIRHGIGKEKYTDGGGTIEHAMGEDGWPATLGAQGDI